MLSGWVRRASVTALVLSVLQVLPGQALANAAPRQDAPHPCATATRLCEGTIRVPLNWDDPSASEQITVAFSWTPRTDHTRPAAGTILASPGGPGPALGSVTAFQQALGPLLERHNLLLVDPRGHGKSTPLECPGLDVRRPETIRACAEHLGDKAPYFTTDQAAHDLEAVRAALGADKVTFYGMSHGTLLAQAYATRFPRHLVAVFLESVITTDARGYDPTFGAVGTSRAFRNLGRVCDASRACREAMAERGGTPRRLWGRLVERLRSRPDPKVPLLTVSTMLGALYDAMFARETVAAVAAYLQDDPAPLRRLAAVIPAGTGGGDPAPQVSAGLLAYTCADTSFPYDRNAPPDVRRRQLADHYTDNEPFWPFTPEEALGEAGFYAEWCLQWPTPRPAPPVEPGATYPDVPVLAMGGGLDRSTPGSNAIEVAARFPRGSGFSVPFGGHGMALHAGPPEACARAAMRSFISDPRHPFADPGCSEESDRALGDFPGVSGEVPVRTTHRAGIAEADVQRLAAAFATIADAAARRNPNAPFGALLREERGLRGGRIDFDDAARTIHLDRVRFVRDLAVTGRIQVAGEYATATVRVSGAGRPAGLRLKWSAFQPVDTTRVTGTFGGRPFDIRLPVP